MMQAIINKEADPVSPTYCNITQPCPASALLKLSQLFLSLDKLRLPAADPRSPRSLLPQQWKNTSPRSPLPQQQAHSYVEGRNYSPEKKEGGKSEVTVIITIYHRSYL